MRQCHGVTCRTLRPIPLASAAAPHLPKNRGEGLAYPTTAGAMRLAGTRKCINTGGGGVGWGGGRGRLFPVSETLAIDLTETRWLRDPPYKDHLSLIFHKPWDIRQIKTLEISQHPLGRLPRPGSPVLARERERGKQKRALTRVFLIFIQPI